MKLYLITTHDEEQQQVRWVGSQADAASIRADLVKGGVARKDIKTTAIDVPTNKEGLLDFLGLLSRGVNVVIATDRLLAK